jgi:hypothetical protein
MTHGGDLLLRHNDSRATELSTRRPRARQSGLDPFHDAPALELRYGPEDVHLEFPGGCRRVDPLRQRHEPDAQRLQLVEQRDQVFQVAPEAVKPPADDDIEAAAFGVAQELHESRA